MMNYETNIFFSVHVPASNLSNKRLRDPAVDGGRYLLQAAAPPLSRS